MGHSLKWVHYKGRVVPSRKQTIHKLSGAKSGLSGPKRVPGPLFKQHSHYSQSSTHPRLAECDSRQTIQAGPDHSNRVVPPCKGFPGSMLRVAPAQSRPVCHQVQQQTSKVCLTSSRPPSLGSGCTQSVFRGACTKIALFCITWPTYSYQQLA